MATPQHRLSLAPLTEADLAVLRAPRQGADNALIEAANDLEAVAGWLSQYRDRPNTLAAYNREARRFLLWCARVRARALHQLRLEDFLAYQAFLQDPPEDWIGPRRPVDHPDWKPLRKPLAPAATRQALVVLNSLTSYLNEARYLHGNPLSVARHARRAHDGVAAGGADKALDHRMVDAIIETLKAGIHEPGISRLQAQRDRLIVALGLYCGLRISEMTTLREVDVRTRGHIEPGSWWLRVTGKGRRQDWLPLADPARHAMHCYRIELGEAPDPDPYGELPLLRAVPADGDHPAPLARSTLYRRIKSVYSAAAERLDDVARARDLRLATPHSLRHTLATQLIADGVAIDQVRQMLRHGSINTTMRYNTDDARALVRTVARASAAWDRVNPA